ncbi:MAG TPA: lipoate--protein ligase family protein [Candidatus Binatia bacterium]
MKYLELTLPGAAQNLACDEALLLAAEERGGEEVLRLWEPRRYFAVVGHASRSGAEVALAACRERRVPVLRRLSGGAAVLQGPGCLNYALVLKLRRRPALRDVPATNAFVMARLRRALAPLVESPITVQGFTDLVLGTRKFSGNAQYRKRRALLFHGSILLDFDIPLIEEFVLSPPRQPAYRQKRPHGEFLTNLHLPAAAVKAALIEAWGAEGELATAPLDGIETLVKDRYSRDEWNFRF